MLSWILTHLLVRQAPSGRRAYAQEPTSGALHPLPTAIAPAWDLATRTPHTITASQRKVSSGQSEALATFAGFCEGSRSRSNSASPN